METNTTTVYEYDSVEITFNTTEPAPPDGLNILFALNEIGDFLIDSTQQSVRLAPDWRIQ